MARREQVSLDITARDQASRTVEHVADEVEQLEEAPAEVVLTAEDDATKVVRKAADEVEQLTDEDRAIVLRARVDDLRGQLKSAEADLERFKAKGHEAEQAVEQIGSRGAIPAGNAIADLTGPLGEASSMASDFAGAFEGAGELAGGIATKLGASEAMAGRVVGAFGGIGLAAAGVAAAWGLITQRQAKAREEAKRVAEATADIAKALREGKAEEAAAGLVEEYGDLFDEAHRAGIGMREVAEALTGQRQGLPGVSAELERYRDLMAEAADEARRNGQAVPGWDEQHLRLRELEEDVLAAADAWQTANGELDSTAQRTAVVTDVLAGAGNAAADAAVETDRLTQSYEDLRGALAVEQTALDVANALDSAEEAATAAYLATVQYGVGSEEATDANRELEGQLLDARQSVIDYAESVGGIPDEQMTRIQALIDQGKLTEAQHELDMLEQQRTVPVDVELAGDWGQWQDFIAAGGINNRPRSVAPTAVTNVTIHAPRGMRARDVIAEADRWHRRNGGRGVRT